MVSSNNNFEYDLQFGQIWEQKIADILLNEKIVFLILQALALDFEPVLYQ